jgi:hypothetical protein
MPTDKHVNATIATFSGLRLSLCDPKANQIRLRDISHGLSFACRYACQVADFYSVAEHSVLVCQLLELRYPENKSLHRWGLMHDASEAYLGDMPKPLKNLDKFYQGIEAVFMDVLARKYHLKPVRQPQEVHTADMDVFLRERKVLWGPGVYEWRLTNTPPEDTLGLDVLGLPSRQADELFLATFERVFGELQE